MGRKYETFQKYRKGGKNVIWDPNCTRALPDSDTSKLQHLSSVLCWMYWMYWLKKAIIRIRFVQFWTKSISKPSKQVIIFTVIPRQTWCCCFFPADVIVSQSKVLTICTKPCSGWGGENENLSNALAVPASHCHHSSTMTSLF